MKKIFYITIFITITINAQQVTTVTGFAGFADGTLTTAQFSGPWGLCTDPTGNIIYVADSFNHKIRKIDLINNLVTTIAGSVEGFADGVGSMAKFYYPRSVCLDNNGFLFVTDESNHKIRKIDLSTNIVTTFAGSTQGYINGIGSNAKFNEPFAICIDSNNNLFVSEYQGHRIRKITATGQVSNLAGSGTAGFADGTGTSARFFGPDGLCVDAQNNIYVADTFNARVRKITPSGAVTTIAGSATAGYLDGTALQAKFSAIFGICMDNNNNLYVVDNNTRIRKVDLTLNMVSTFMDTNTSIDDPRELYFKNDIIYFTAMGACKIKKLTDILATEDFEQKAIKLYPNPNNGKFTIINLENFNIEIYDILGHLVFTKKAAQNVIETGLKKGIYFVKITNEEGKIETQKMVVD